MDRDALNEVVNGLSLTVECPKCKGERHVRDPSIQLNKNSDPGAFGVITIGCDMCESKGRIKLKKLKFESC